MIKGNTYFYFLTKDTYWLTLGRIRFSWLPKWDTQAINKAFHKFVADPDPFGANFLFF